MLKRVTLLLIVFCVGMTAANAYTVVLKNGKTLSGNLVSETEQMIIFKDDTGLQYSLKKANLDLEKMKEANAPKMEPPPVAPPAEAPQTPKKKARVYTKEDLEAIRSKYPELSIGEPVERPEDYVDGKLTTEAFLRRLQDGGSMIRESASSMTVVRDSILAAWEPAVSAKNDPREAVNGVLATSDSTAAIESVSTDLETLGTWQETMKAPPDQYKEVYGTFVSAITALSEFHRLVREWYTLETPDNFRSKTSASQNQINTTLSGLQSVAPAPVAPAEPAPSEEPAE